MRIRALVASVAVSSIGGGASAATVVALPWDGFGVGSWVRSRTSMSTAGDGKVSRAPDILWESKQTLVAISPGAYTWKVERMSAGSKWKWSSTEKTLSRLAGDLPPARAAGDATKPEDLGTEKVTVDGSEYVCKKSRVTGAWGSTTKWTHDTHGVLKSESNLMGSLSGSSVVEKLAEKLRVGDKVVECRREKSSSRLAASEWFVTTWTSKAVPGHDVKSVSVSETGSTTSNQTTELIAFEARPLAAK